MKKKANSKKLVLWGKFVKLAKKFLQSSRNVLRKFSDAFPNVTQGIQLTCVYFFAYIDVTYSILTQIYSLGYFPDLLQPFFPFIVSILQNPFLKVWGSPEKVFFLSYIVLEFMVVRDIFKFSKLVRYNILLIFSMLMIQGLICSYWDLLFHREIAAPVARWAIDNGTVFYTDKPLAIGFFLSTFALFMISYTYLYLRAISGKFGTIWGMEWLTDSVAFWLRIKTPSMRFGKRKKDQDDPDLDDVDPMT
jgi:hypothetical protein